jgi:hypothetical protein
MTTNSSDFKEAMENVIPSRLFAAAIPTAAVRTVGAKSQMSVSNVIAAALKQMHRFIQPCRTSEMSHAGIWRAACDIAIRNHLFNSITRKEARGVTDPGVGSGALFGDGRCEGSAGLNSNSRLGRSSNWLGMLAQTAANHLGCRLQDLKRVFAG